MADKQSEWEDWKDMTPKWLMDKALNKYNILTNKEIWESSSAEQEKLIALEARIFELKRRIDGRERSVNEEYNNQPSKNEKKGKIKQCKNKPSWMFKEPTEENLNTNREWNGTTRHF